MTSQVLGAVCLEHVFDAAALAHDVDALTRRAWTPHFNTGAYQGAWSALTLRGPGGREDVITPGHGPPIPMQDTPLMAACPALAAAVRFFQAPVGSVRLMRLDAGATIRPHRDSGLALEDRLDVRLHIPVVTHPQVVFTLEGRLIPMAAGQCWYVNVNLTHAVHNGSALDRIHLVLDVRVNAWLWDLLQAPSNPARIHVSPPDRTPDPLAVAAELRRQGTPTALALAESLEAAARERTRS